MNYLAIMASSFIFSQPISAQLANTDQPSCELYVWAEPPVENDISMISAGLLNGSFEKKMQRGDKTVTENLLKGGLLINALKASAFMKKFNIAPDKVYLRQLSNLDLWKEFVKTPTNNETKCRIAFSFSSITFEKNIVHGTRMIMSYTIIDRTVKPKRKIYNWFNSEKMDDFDPGADEDKIALVLQDCVRRIIDDVVLKMKS